MLWILVAALIASRGTSRFGGLETTGKAPERAIARSLRFSCSRILSIAIYSEGYAPLAHKPGSCHDRRAARAGRRDVVAVSDRVELRCASEHPPPMVMGQFIGSWAHASRDTEATRATKDARQRVRKLIRCFRARDSP